MKANELKYTKMKQLISVFLLLISITGFSQNPLVLELSECIEKALSNHPKYRDSVYITEISRLKMQNVRTGFYPRVDMNAKAQYLSDVIDIGVKSTIPGLEFPSPQNDQYNLTLDVSQVIYDGGIISSQEDLAQLSGMVDNQQLKVELYQIRERVNALFFNVLFLQQKSELIKSVAGKLLEKRKEICSAVDNGLLTQSDLYLLDAEILKLNQQFSEVSFSVSSGIQVLEMYMDTLLPGNILLSKPKLEVNYSGLVKRPEYPLFDYQLKQLSINDNLLEASKRPKVSGFGQVGYGRPGLNYMNDKFDSFYIVGARFTWNIWDWNKTNREREQIALKKNLVSSQKKTFDENLYILLSRVRKEIQKWQVMIERDLDIIELTSKVVKASESRLKNGVITTADYINDLHRQIQAKIDMELHEIRLIESKTKYMTLKGW